MTTKKSPAKKPLTRKLKITRVIHAPRALVFKAWTDPHQIAQWFSPQEIECRSVKANVKVGGTFRIHMVSKKGDHIAHGKYIEIIPNERLQFTWHWEKYTMPQSIVTVEYEDHGEDTRLTFTHEGLPHQKDANDHKKGWNSALKKFALMMEQGEITGPEDFAGREFVIKYKFTAPRELVFKAWTDPKHVAQWWGPRGFTNPVCQWDPRPGKAIHVVMRAPNGAEFPMGGEFREMVAPEKLVFTSGALNEKGKLMFELLHAVTFVEKKGETMLTIHSRVIKTTTGSGKYIGGFEAGMTQSLVRLGEHLETTVPPLEV